MKERPIIFSEPMVRAILVGRKTQTRRVVKPQPNRGSELTRMQDGYADGFIRAVFAQDDEPNAYGIKCPFGQHGDRLWVRENGWERPDRTRKQMREGADTWAPYYYDADGICVADIDGFGFKRRPSIHMPRWASRITLEITAVRVERLQDISEEDAMAEGVRWTAGATTQSTPRSAFMHLWESIHGPGSWELNPFVWVLEFKRVEEQA